MTTQQGNELIARFMGGVYNDVYNPSDPHYDFKNGVYSVDELLYHASWDWLMQVVEKIAKSGFRVKTNFNPIDNSVIVQSVTDSEQVLSIMYYSQPIEAVYTAVVQFIQWYNNQKQQS